MYRNKNIKITTSYTFHQFLKKNESVFIFAIRTSTQIIYLYFELFVRPLITVNEENNDADLSRDMVYDIDCNPPDSILQSSNFLLFTLRRYSRRYLLSDSIFSSRQSETILFKNAHGVSCFSNADITFQW